MGQETVLAYTNFHPRLARGCGTASTATATAQAATRRATWPSTCDGCIPPRGFTGRPSTCRAGGLIVGIDSKLSLDQVSQKYFALARFMRHIRPAVEIIDGGSDYTVVAYDAGAKRLAMVAVN